MPSVFGINLALAKRRLRLHTLQNKSPAAVMQSGFVLYKFYFFAPSLAAKGNEYF